MSWRRTAATAAVLATAGLAAAAPAQATFHEMQVREVYPGSLANPKAEYVELQMWASGQNFVKDHVVRAYGPTGAVTGEGPFRADVTNGANQSTILIDTMEAETQFAVGGDATLIPAGAPLPAGMLDPSGGAVCWESLDCVTWGNFSGSLAGLSSAGTPAAAIPDGQALRRGIASGCPTLLEQVDDHDNSAIDFAAVPPQPRPNSLAPTEIPCTHVDPPGKPPKLPRAPQTTLRRHPPKRTQDHTPTFSFVANQAKSTFQCRIDRKPFRGCRSPYTAKSLSPGHHRFSVRASDTSASRTDSTPASYSFTVLR